VASEARTAVKVSPMLSARSVVKASVGPPKEPLPKEPLPKEPLPKEPSPKEADLAAGFVFVVAAGSGSGPHRGGMLGTSGGPAGELDRG
jgi:hypothetical protein